MWQRLGKFVINNRLVLLILLLAGTVVMGYYAARVKLSYEFSKAIEPIIPNTGITSSLSNCLAMTATSW